MSGSFSCVYSSTKTLDLAADLPVQVLRRPLDIMPRSQGQSPDCPDLSGHNDQLCETGECVHAGRCYQKLIDRPRSKNVHFNTSPDRGPDRKPPHFNTPILTPPF